MSEPEPSAPAPAPLPLSDLLAALRDRGLPLGVREHLAVGRLLARFDDPDLPTLRAALAALLARNPAEAELVRTAFDQLYTAPPEEEEPPSSPPRGRQRLAASWSRLRQWSRRRWLVGLGAVALALALAVFAGSWGWHRRHPPAPSRVGPAPAPAATPAPDRPPPPEITDTYASRNRSRTLAATASAATLVFLWLYLVRTRRLARGHARRLWSAELDALPGPQGYDLVLADLPPPFAAEVLDDVASVLGRQSAGVPRGGELDVDRTLARTLRAGLAPHVVLRARAAPLPVLVLADVADGMLPWQRRIAGLLAGLEARGVALDVWRFNADAGRVFRSPAGPALSLRQLARLRAESPLLVISAGRGVLEGDDFAVAPWVELLRVWRQRAWLHPAADPRTWSAALRRVPLEVWPMTRAGLLAAARQVARGDVRLPGLQDARTPPERPPTPLDVDRMRWLLTLAPRRDPDLAELLRRRFCPHVPEAALIEALAAPPLDRAPGVGPTAAEVHAFLLAVLDDSQPPQGNVAHERWRLDRALQRVHLAPEEAAAELADLAAGPLGGEVERSLRSLPRETIHPLQSQVLRPLSRRATRDGLFAESATRAGRRWTWPTAGEIAAALIAAALTRGAAPWLGKALNDESPVRQQIAYRMTVADPNQQGPFGIDVDSLTASTAPVFLAGDLPGFSSPLRSMEPKREVPYSRKHRIVLDEDKRGHWYYARARLDRETLAVSPAVWVDRAKPAVAPPPRERPPGRPAPSLEGTPTAKPRPKPVPRWSLADRRTPAAAQDVQRPPTIRTNRKPVQRRADGTKPEAPPATVTEVPKIVQEVVQEPAAQKTLARPYQPPAGKEPGIQESTEQRYGKPVRVLFRADCYDSGEAIYDLRSGEEYVDAKLEVLQEAWVKREQTLGTPVYDEKLRRVKAIASFRRKRLGSQPCSDLGSADIRLLVTVRLKQPQSPKRD